MFDDSVSHAEKSALATAILSYPKPQRFAPGKSGQPTFNLQISKHTCQKPSLSVFVTERSWLMLHLIKADTAWLSEPPAT